MIENIPCPNPNRHGCGCPHASARCYGNIRAVRAEFNSWLGPVVDLSDMKLHL